MWRELHELKKPVDPAGVEKKVDVANSSNQGWEKEISKRTATPSAPTAAEELPKVQTPRQKYELRPPQSLPVTAVTQYILEQKQWSKEQKFRFLFTYLDTGNIQIQIRITVTGTPVLMCFYCNAQVDCPIPPDRAADSLLSEMAVPHQNEECHCGCGLEDPARVPDVEYFERGLECMASHFETTESAKSEDVIESTRAMYEATPADFLLDVLAYGDDYSGAMSAAITSATAFPGEGGQLAAREQGQNQEVSSLGSDELQDSALEFEETAHCGLTMATEGIEAGRGADQAAEVEFATREESRRALYAAFAASEARGEGMEAGRGDDQAAKVVIRTREYYRRKLDAALAASEARGEGRATGHKTPSILDSRESVSGAAHDTPHSEPIGDEQAAPEVAMVEDTTRKRKNEEAHGPCKKIRDE